MRVKSVPVSVSGAAAYSVYHRYDVRGLLAEARFGSDSGQGISNAYDGFGWLRTSSSSMGGTARIVTSDYDAHGNRRKITHPDGNYFEYQYDTADRLFHIGENGTTTTLATFGYDGQRRRESLARSTAGASSVYQYDLLSRLEVLGHNLDGGGTTNDAGFGFAYNPASQITRRVQINDAYEAPFAAAVQSYVTNGRNQYTQVGGTTQGWDDNGNLTSDGPSPTGTTFGYDTENRLVSASGAKAATLKYDPLGRLWEVSIPSGPTNRFVYDGDRLIAEYSTGGAVQRRYVHGPEVDEPLLGYEGAAVSAAARRYLHADHQGSIVAVSNNTGVKQQIHTYDPYGVNGAPNSLRFQYTGQATLPDLGLYYYKARFYSPTLGRFLQTDPIGYEDDNNLYAYVGNDPLNKTDPTGRQSKAAGKELGRFLRILFSSDPDKTRAEIEKERQAERKMAEKIVDISRLGIVKDAVEIAIDASKGEDTTAQGTGALTGEAAGAVVESALDGKIGPSASEAIGAVVGEMVEAVVESSVESARSDNSSGKSNRTPPQ